MTVLFTRMCCCAAALAAFSAFAIVGELTGEEEAILRAARQGEVVHLDRFLESRSHLPVIPIRIRRAGGPQLLLSDKPEYLLSGDGITLREAVKPGKVRLYLYHVPTPGAEPKTISAVVENLGSHPLKLRFIHRAFPRPGADYHLIGKTGLLDFFNSRPAINPLRLAPGTRAVLDPQLDAAVATRDQLVHGFYEFEINQPTRVTVFQRGVAEQSVRVIDSLPLLPQKLPGKETGNGAGRGLFPISNFSAVNEPGLVIDTANGAQQLIVANGRDEGWVEGHDSIDARATRNTGNYGVMYRMRLTRASSDGRSLALLMGKIDSTSRWCGAQAGAVQVSKGLWPGGTVAAPGNRVSFGKPGEAVILQRFPPLRKGKSETIEIVYSPPGASCIPTPMLLVPYREIESRR